MEKKELKLLFVTTLVLGFCFSFRDWGVNSFDFSAGIINLFATTILVGISIIVHEFFHRKMAARYGATLEFKTWNVLLLSALIITVLTNGYIIFAAVWAVSITTPYLLRPRHKYPHLGPWERAKIAAVGPLSNFTLGIISAWFAIKTGHYIWHKLVIINLWIAAMNVFPFFRLIPAFMLGSKQMIHNISYKLTKGTYNRAALPYMEGEIIFFGSKSLGVFLMVFLIITSIIIIPLKMISLGLLVGLSTAISAYLWVMYHKY